MKKREFWRSKQLPVIKSKMMGRIKTLRLKMLSSLRFLGHIDRKRSQT